MSADFTHLHVHSNYSLLDSTIRIEDLVKTASEDKMSALALTDHGNMFGAFEFVATAYKNTDEKGDPKVKPIVGCEFYVVKDRHIKTFTKDAKDDRYHQVLLAKNAIGYQNLIKLTSLGYIEGMYSKYPRIDKELIEQAIERTKKDGTYEDKEIRNKLEFLLNIATQSFDNTSKKLIFKFLVSPVEIIGDEKIEAVRFKTNNLMNNSTNQSSEKFEIQSGLLISCTGYEPDKHALSEIENGKLKNSAGKISQNLYCVGWAKRGSSGVIGTNKSDATDVVELIISELDTPKNNSKPENCIKPTKKIITQNHWQNMNNREIELGIELGKPRLKTPNVDKLISLSGN